MASARRLADGRVGLRPPGPPRVMIGADVRRGAEIDVRPLFFGHRLDLRVFFLEPLPNQRLIAFDRAMQWLLTSDADLRQQPANWPASMMLNFLLISVATISRVHNANENCCNGFFCVTVA